MTVLRFESMPVWSEKPTSPRQQATFRVSWPRTVEELTYEAWRLRARELVLQIGLATGDIRNDGMPRSNARAVSHPGVAIVLTGTRHGDLRYATDRYTTWQDNARAITLSLEALRAVDRYGVTRRGEQYVGSRALPPGTPMGGGETLTEDAALRMLHDLSGMPVDKSMSPDDLRSAYRAAAKACHPDSGGTGASGEVFGVLELAARVLGIK